MQVWQRKGRQQPLPYTISICFDHLTKQIQSICGCENCGMLLRGGYFWKICKHTYTMNVCVFAAFVAIVSIIVYNCPVAYSLEDKTYRMSENCIWLFEEIWSSCSKKALWTGLWGDYRIWLDRVNFKQISSSRVF